MYLFSTRVLQLVFDSNNIYTVHLYCDTFVPVAFMLPKTAVDSSPSPNWSKLFITLSGTRVSAKDGRTGYIHLRPFDRGNIKIYCLTVVDYTKVLFDDIITARD